MIDAYVILNPAAGRGQAGEREREVREALRHAGMKPVVQRTLKPGHGTALARAAVRAGAPFVVAAGGDGTINEVAQGLVDTNVPLGMLPLGSGNDYVRVLGIPSNLPGATAILTRTRTRKVDIGSVGDRCYLNSLGMGIDGQIAWDYKRHWWLKGAPGYYIAAVYQMLRFRAFDAEVEAEGWAHRGQHLAISVMNGPYAGGGFHLAPGAAIDDGQLDVTMAGDYSRPMRLWVLPKTRNGSYLERPRMRRECARALTIHADRAVPVHMDGEVLTHPMRKLSITLIPMGLSVIA